MAGSMPIKKVYIDNRFKTKDSKSNSHCKYELVVSIQLPDKYVCFVDDVTIPARWYNIDENDKIHLCTTDARYRDGSVYI